MLNGGIRLPRQPAACNVKTRMRLSVASYDAPLVFVGLLAPSLLTGLSFEDDFFFSGSLSLGFFSFLSALSPDATVLFLCSATFSLGAMMLQLLRANAPRCAIALQDA